MCVCFSADGKLYDAYVSYVNNESDRKLVTFILKPQLEAKAAYKVHLNDNDILPGGGEMEEPGSSRAFFFSEFEALSWKMTIGSVSPEPSAELLMNISRSRRLIVLLSHAYLEQDWCSNNFR